jgi:hypothetical protein
MAALVSLIIGAIAHHSIGALVGAPLWVMMATAVLMAAAVVGRHKVDGRVELDRYLRRVLTSAAAGLVAGWMLPATLAPPLTGVTTHSTVHAAHGDLFEALDELDDHPQLVLGRRITVTGSWHPQHGDALATVSQRVMACCVADAVDVGFDVIPVRRVEATAGSHVRVVGTVQALLHDGETRYALIDADVKALNEGSSAVK